MRMPNKFSPVKLFIAPLLMTAFLSPLTGVAQTPEQRGLEISQEADRRGDGFDDFRAEMEMILENRHGDE